MHFWTKEAFLERCRAKNKSDGYEPRDRIQCLLEEIGDLVELAYNEGFKDGKEAAQQTT